MPISEPDSTSIGAQRILVIDGGPLDGTSSAGERASVDLLDALVSLGADVRFLPMGSKGTADAGLLQDLGRRGVAQVYPPGGGALAALLSTHPVDAVIANRPGPAAMASVALGAHPEVARLYWGHDIHSRRLAAQQGVRGDVEGHRAQAIALAERRCWDFYDLTVYPTEREAALCAEVTGSARAIACPYFLLSGIDAPPSSPGRGGRRGLLMVGGASHAPNLDALEWTVAEIMPIMRALHPRMTLTVVGDWPDEQETRLAAPGVHFAGRVPDEELRRLHDVAVCLVAPLRFGSGARRKIVAAMGLGLPVVTTPEGQEGLLVRDGMGLEDGLMIAADAPSLTDAIVALADDSELWHRCADTARQAAWDVYAQIHYTRGIARALRRAAANRDARR